MDLNEMISQVPIYRALHARLLLGILVDFCAKISK